MTREHLFLRELRKLFDLRGDMDEPGDIEASVRQGVKTRGTNLWILMFAILVASIGLNVNSTAVIIGAMLDFSPDRPHHGDRLRCRGG